VNLADAALWYASNGVPVFRLVPKAKDPLEGSHGHLDATTDLAIVAEWWREMPRANIGIPMRTADLVAIDIDPRNGGPAERDEFIRLYGPIPDTAEQTTGGGGRHIIFRQPKGNLKLPAMLGPGVDVKDNGYVVAAPSVHPSGRRYGWDGIEGARALLHPADLPAWFLKRTKATSGNGRGKESAKIPAVIRCGERHDTCVSLAGSMRRRDCNSEEIYAALLKLSERFESPVPSADLRAIAEDIAGRYAPAREAASLPDAPAGHAPQEQHRSEMRIVPAYAPNGRCKETGATGRAPAEGPDAYPRPMGEDAYYGIAGRFVRLVEPQTEADPNWLLLLFMTYAGNVFGRRAYIRRDGCHFPNLFSCAVGPTSGGRKGTAFFPVELFFRGIDDDWLKSIQSGLSSGEGLIWCVRDAIYKRNRDGHEVLDDPGISDKRLLVRQTEFFGALQAMRRHGSTLSPTLRDAWDRGYLNSMTKNSPARATDAHISLAANIPPEELRRGLLADDVDNGFANRFLWCCSRGSKFLPEGGKDLDADLQELRRQFNRVNINSLKGEVTLNADAQDIWGYNSKPDTGLYRRLAAPRPGMFGQVTARAAQQVLRLALVHAQLDGVLTIGPSHLEAALEIWRYCEDSCRYLFGDLIGDSTADAILKALRSAPQEGLTRWEINKHFTGNKPAAEIERALHLLAQTRKAGFAMEDTGGKRPAQRWFLTE
jgi:hypothetical protein